MASVWVKVKKMPVWVWYLCLVATVVFAYSPVKERMINQEGTFLAVIGGVTFNMILLYGLWGLVSDRMGKGKPRWYGWVVCGIGFVALTLFFRFAGGLETIFG